MKLLFTCLAASLACSACVTVAPLGVMPAGPATHTTLRIEPASPPPAHAFPRRLSTPELPTAVALSDWWRGRDHLSADVRLCVAPDGKTADVRLLRSSGFREYDDAIVIDVARWRYEPFTGESSADRCEPATVTYLP